MNQSHVFKVNDDRILMFGWTIIVRPLLGPRSRAAAVGGACVLRSTSGARYSGVPQNVLMVASSVIPSLQRPKSVIFICPSLSSMRFSSWVNRERDHHQHITTLLSSVELLCCWKSCFTIANVILYNSSKNKKLISCYILNTISSILSVLINFINENSSNQSHSRTVERLWSTQQWFTTKWIHVFERSESMIQWLSWISWVNDSMTHSLRVTHCTYCCF